MTTSNETFEMKTGAVRPIYLPVGHLGERVVICLIGQHESGEVIAVSIAPRPLKCLSETVAFGITNFGSLVCADYSRWAAGPRNSEWIPPLQGLEIGQQIDIDGQDHLDVERIALSMCALRTDTDGRAVAGRGSNITGTSPRSREEHRFLDAVRLEVTKTLPQLENGFCRPFSLTGTAYGGEIDFVGTHYATCYSAINPKARTVSRVQTAAAGLWRLARARDAFGFASPSVVELTAWVPPPGLPVYSESDYRTCDETVAELREQAKREGLTLFPVTHVSEAGGRLLAVETTNPN
jgi:hypothetical protein